MITNPECTCKKVKCERHGDCEACRAHHADLKSPVRCERGKKKRTKER